MSADVTVDEIISLLNHSSLPTVIVEGDIDIIAYRFFEYDGPISSISVLPVGGRDRLLNIFDRRSEISSGEKLVFVADMDTWILTGVPPHYDDEMIVFTWGYSVENDLYDQSDIERVLSNAECVRFHQELTKFIRWYALSCSRLFTGISAQISTHPASVIGDESRYEELCKLDSEEVYPNEYYDVILADYKKLVRGKSLLALLVRQLSRPGRKIKHSHASLIEMMSIIRGERIERIRRKVIALISPQPHG